MSETPREKALAHLKLCLDPGETLFICLWWMNRLRTRMIIGVTTNTAGERFVA